MARFEILLLLVGSRLRSAWRRARGRLDAEAESDRLFEMAPDVLCVMRADGRFERMNPTLQRLVAGDDIADLPSLVHPQDQAQVRDALAAITTSPDTAGGTVLEVRCRAREGWRWFAWSLRCDSASRTPRVYAAAHDVTDRKRAEAALSAETSFRRAMEDSLVTGMRVFDLQGRITYVNRAFCQMLGFDESELIGLTAPFPYWPPGTERQSQAMFATVLTGDAPPGGFDVRLMRKDGRLIDARMYVSALIDRQGNKIGWMSSITDITAQRKALEMQNEHQERLQRTARLVTMGEMASSLAHELNQPLSAISNYTLGLRARVRRQIAAQQPIDPDELLDVIARTAGQADRASRVIRRIREFVKRSEPERRPSDVAAIAANAVALADIDARRWHVRIDTHLAPALPPIDADPILIEQVLLNLLKNGVDAMATSARRELTLRVTNGAGNVEFCVTDCGIGIDAESRLRLFEPFFTTKPEGMGMGLNICRSIVEAHGGRLWYEPGAHGGSVFRFSLPISESMAEAA